MFIILQNIRAKNDLLTAAEYYEIKQKGLGLRFIDEYEALENYISQNPNLFPEKHRAVRVAQMKKFPYKIVFRVIGNYIRIISVFNCYQNPKKLKKVIR